VLECLKWIDEQKIKLTEQENKSSLIQSKINDYQKQLTEQIVWINEQGSTINWQKTTIEQIHTQLQTPKPEHVDSIQITQNSQTVYFSSKKQDVAYEFKTFFQQEHLFKEGNYLLTLNFSYETSLQYDNLHGELILKNKDQSVEHCWY